MAAIYVYPVVSFVSWQPFGTTPQYCLDVLLNNSSFEREKKTTDNDPIRVTIDEETSEFECIFGKFLHVQCKFFNTRKPYFCIIPVQHTWREPKTFKTYRLLVLVYPRLRFSISLIFNLFQSKNVVSQLARLTAERSTSIYLRLSSYDCRILNVLYNFRKNTNELDYARELLLSKRGKYYSLKP